MVEMGTQAMGYFTSGFPSWGQLLPVQFLEVQEGACGVAAPGKRLQTLPSPETGRTGPDRSADKRSEDTVAVRGQLRKLREQV